MYFKKIISAVLIVGITLFLSACDTSDNHIVSFMHANINCSDLEESQIFYEKLGFTDVMRGDSEVSADFAAALKMPPYTLSFKQMISRDWSLIDLIKWDDPFDNATAYSSVNHLGLARLTLKTSDLDADIITLESQGIEFFSEPVTVESLSGTKKFVLLKDPDGTIIELVESGPPLKPDFEINITGFKSVNINCSDYGESKLFYEHLGFISVEDIEDNSTIVTAEAYDLPSYKLHGSLMELKNGGPAINLLEWEDPFDNSTPYEKLNHLGIARIALRSNDLDADIVRLKAEGFEFYSEPVLPDGLLAFLRIVCLEDPDGTVIELVEMFPGLLN